MKTLMLPLLVFCSGWLYAQTFTTSQLPTPSNVRSSFQGSRTGAEILYGATPPNLDLKKPVVVYVHGFNELGRSWFRGNEIYDETYNNGQNCAFASMTSNGGMWVNGNLLAAMIDDITARFGVNDVVIVAHSNGGKASEVALFWESRSNKVERVITLGTPFFGTPLANVAQVPGLNWIANLIGVSGTSTSTTYYMSGYARPLLDNLSNNQPGKFINFGAWGYNTGNIFNSLPTISGGNVLNTLGAGPSTGGNDGVTPYWSSTRPGGRPQWVPGHGNPVSRYNHQQIVEHDIIWPWLRPRLTASLANLRLDESQIPHPAEVTRTLSSGYQLLSSEDDQLTFVVERDLRYLNLNILHRSAKDQFNLQREIAPKTWVSLDVNFQDEKRMPLNDGYNTTINISDLEPGRYRLASDATFAAFVNQNKGVRLTFDNSHQFGFDEQPTFSAKLERAQQYDLSQATFKAVMTLKSDLQGATVEEQVWIEKAHLDAEGNVTFAPSTILPVGVYNMVLHAQHPEFQKALITGFVVRQNKARAARQMTTLQVQTYPNPATDRIFVDLDNEVPVQLRLYGIQGNVLYEQQVTSVGKQQLSIDLTPLSIVQGTYFVEITEGTQKQTQTIVVVPK